MPASAFASLLLDFRPSVSELMDQVAITKKLTNMTFTLGAFFSFSKVRESTDIPGLLLTTLEPNPEVLNVSVLTPGGQTLQVTNPEGVSAPVGGVTTQTGRWDQVSVFFGHNWDFAKNWRFDWGFRLDDVDISARNPTLTGQPPAVASPEGPPNSTYNNSYTPPPTSFLTFGKTIINQSYTAALYRKIDQDQSFYLRYSNAEKAPSLDIFLAQNDPTKTQFANTSSQKIQQVELGYKYTQSNLSLVVTPYYSLLNNIQTTQLFVNPLNSTFYTRISANALESYGVEIEGDWKIGNGFALRAALTVEKGIATKRFNWLQGPSGPASDTLVDLSGGKADNNPDMIASITPSYTKGRFYAQVQWQYMGTRPANAEDAFTLPAYNTTNPMVSWQLTPRLSISATVNNVFNNAGVVEFTVPATNLVADLNRQSLTQQQVQANPNALFTILPVQPRAYFLEAKYQF
jgi:outer membrane receptor protein involved in Fe transport